MSFGDHLEELRVALFRSLIGVLVACGITMFYADRIVNFFQLPLTKAMQKYQQKRAEKKLADEMGVKDLAPEIKRLILDHALVPETIRVETRAFLHELRKETGETVTSQYSPQLFLLSELLQVNVPALAKELVNSQKEEKGSVLKRLWQSCSAEDQAVLTKIASEEAATADNRQQLLGVLNRLIALPELYKAEEFKEVVKPDSAMDVVKKQVETGATEIAKQDARMELQRMLIRETFVKDFPATVPLMNLPVYKRLEVRFTVLNTQEAFMIWMKAGVVAGLVLASPWVFYQIWLFVAAGLYPHEKKQIYVYLPMAIILFLAGASLAFSFVFEPVLDFLFSFNDSLNAEFQPRIGEWLSFVLLMPIGFGVSFQLPLVMLLLNRLGVVSVELFAKQWRIAILVIAIASMILTPGGDPFSMMLMALPLCLLYLLGIGMCIYMPRGQSPFSQAYEP